MNFYIYFINRIRVIIKSFLKYEKKIEQYLTYLKWKKRIKNSELTDIDFNDNLDELNSNQNNHILPKKIAICIAFYFKNEKIELLKETCSTLNELGEYVDVTIITNEINDSKINKLKNELNKILKNLNIFIAKDLQDPRLLPWCHYLIMREKIIDNSYSHFIFLEDDIKITKKNIVYWINARKALKLSNLIPSFIRTEINYIDKKIYATDYIKRNNLKKLPKIFSKKNNLAFTNTIYPYQGMYLYDRELMNEHLNGPSSSPDFGHGAFDINSININAINMDIVAKANAGLTYKDVPLGFLNRYVVPIDLDKKLAKNYSLIQHLSNEYANKKTPFGKIRINDLFF